MSADPHAATTRELLEARIRDPKTSSRDLASLVGALAKLDGDDRPREFTTGDMGVGECAGEVVAPIDFQLTACEREAFEAQLQLEAGQIDSAAKIAYESMLHAALALLKLQFVVAPEEPDRIVAEFQKHFYDTQLFFDPFTGGKFAQYFFQ